MNFIEDILDSLKSNKDRVFITQILSNNTFKDYTYNDVYERSLVLSDLIKNKFRKVNNENLIIGIVIKNSIDWVVADFACLISGYTVLPFPLAFSKLQAKFLLDQCDGFILDDYGSSILTKNWDIDLDAYSNINLEKISYTNLNNKDLDKVIIKDDFIAKIIHTSGTTSNPKGVKITLPGLKSTLDSLNSMIPNDEFSTYLSLVPLSLLLEQITGIYLPCIRGGRIYFLPKNNSLLGEKELNINYLLDKIIEIQPSAITVPPIILEEFLTIVEQCDPEKYPKLLNYLSLKPYITCGGASISVKTLNKLTSHGFNVYQGYGLSENTSVVSMNTPKNQKLGSVGKPLPHVQVRISKENTIQINGESIFKGYSGLDPSKCDFTNDKWLDTGDIGYFDNDGYLYITGRKKNILSLPNGRNVSPEQVEISINSYPNVISAVVNLDKSNELVALIVYGESIDFEEFTTWTIDHFSIIECPNKFLFINKNDPELPKLFTVTGRPIRNEIFNYINQHS